MGNTKIWNSITTKISGTKCPTGLHGYGRWEFIMDGVILEILRDFVIFAEIQGANGFIDGAYDPDMAVEKAKHILDKENPNWRHGDGAALSA